MRRWRAQRAVQVWYARPLAAGNSPDFRRRLPRLTARLVRRRAGLRWLRRGACHAPCRLTGRRTRYRRPHVALGAVCRVPSTAGGGSLTRLTAVRCRSLGVTCPSTARNRGLAAFKQCLESRMPRRPAVAKFKDSFYNARNIVSGDDHVPCRVFPAHHRRRRLGATVLPRQQRPGRLSS